MDNLPLIPLLIIAGIAYALLIIGTSGMIKERVRRWFKGE